MSATKIDEFNWVSISTTCVLVPFVKGLLVLWPDAFFPSGFEPLGIPVGLKNRNVVWIPATLLIFRKIIVTLLSWRTHFTFYVLERFRQYLLKEIQGGVSSDVRLLPILLPGHHSTYCVTILVVK